MDAYIEFLKGLVSRGDCGSESVKTMGSDVSHVNISVSLIVQDKESRDSVHKSQLLKRKPEPKAGSRTCVLLSVFTSRTPYHQANPTHFDAAG